MSKNGYDDLVLELFPPGCGHPGLTWLRSEIPKLLAKEVATALARQRDEAFPDLQSTRQQNEEYRKRLVDWEAEMGKKHKGREKELDNLAGELNERAKALAGREAALQELLAAFDAYVGWIEGQGDVNDNGRRFADLLKAYKKYKEVTA